MAIHSDSSATSLRKITSSSNVPPNSFLPLSGTDGDVPFTADSLQPFLCAGNELRAFELLSHHQSTKNKPYLPLACTACRYIPGNNLFRYFNPRRSVGPRSLLPRHFYGARSLSLDFHAHRTEHCSSTFMKSSRTFYRSGRANDSTVSQVSANPGMRHGNRSAPRGTA